MTGASCATAEKMKLYHYRHMGLASETAPLSGDVFLTRFKELASPAFNPSWPNRTSPLFAMNLLRITLVTELGKEIVGLLLLWAAQYSQGSFIISVTGN
jgi:hypothetical protein